MLKYIRIVAACAVLLLSLALFLDFAELVPLWLSNLMRVQFIPAVLDRKWLAVVLLLGSVMIFGRLYCSVLCPFGILQDVILRLKKLFARKKKKKKSEYRRPYNVLRYGVLAASAVPVVFGCTVMLTLLDPYSNFGRVVMGLLRPVYVWSNNLLASIMNAAGNYSLYSVSQETAPALLILATVVLAVVAVMVVLRGRLWCNTLCPVGGLFSLLSRYSFFRVKIDSKCTHCNKCVEVCKAECIDQKNYAVDTGRCVSCYNCLNACKFDAIHYSPSKKSDRGYAAEALTEARKRKEERKKAREEKQKEGVKPSESQAGNDYDISRRRFLTGAAAAAVLAPFSGKAFDTIGMALKTRKFPLPPGAADDFRNRCTGCQLCVSKCPMHLLRPSFFERGFSGIMQPHMYFQPHAYCNYECTICTEVCPNGALRKLTVDEKKVCQVGVVTFVKEECIVYKDNQDCGACAEHCPTQAVKMVPYNGTLTIPETDQAICVGCGACESICPVRPLAIYVDGFEPQRIAQKPEETEYEEVKVDGFGF